MLTEAQILNRLDNYNVGCYGRFIDLGHVYSYLIDSRLNIFKDDHDSWAIAAERLGYNPRIGGILLEIYYFGNCLINLEQYNGQNTNNYTVYPIEWNGFNDTVDGEVLKPGSRFWDIRGQQIELSHNKQDYLDAGIVPKEFKLGGISLEEVGRLLITKHRDLFRATDEELYKSIPASLKKILVLDEWYHQDYLGLEQPTLNNENLRVTYEINKILEGDQFPSDFETFVAIYRHQEESMEAPNQDQYQNNRPSSNETWQLIARVIATGDTSLYKPTLAPNTHWMNWPDSGSL